MNVGGVLVATRSDLTHLPTLELPPGASIRPMRHEDPTDRHLWLDVHNDAYGHTWTDAELDAAVLEHRHIRVTDTYLIALDGDVVGAASIGVFRRAEHVAVGHYLGVARRAQRTGVARALVVHRYTVARDRGYTACESQTHVSRVASLRLHFDCGFVPKRGLDTWNNPDTWSRTERWLADRRLERLHRSWAASHAPAERSAG